MRVRSQDKEVLIDVKGCCIAHDYSCKNLKYEIAGCISDKSADYNQWSLGIYKTEEKAMSVLDELQCRIARSESGVYQMPKDEI